MISIINYAKWKMKTIFLKVCKWLWKQIKRPFVWVWKKYLAEPARKLKNAMHGYAIAFIVLGMTFGYSLPMAYAGSDYAHYVPLPNLNYSRTVYHSQTSSIALPVEVANADSEVVEAQVNAVIENKVIRKMEDEVLNILLHSESDGYKALGFDSCNALVTYDPDHSGRGVRVPSFGCFQFKSQTAQLWYADKTGGRLSQNEAQILVQNVSEAQELARYVIFVKNKGASEWVNSFKKHDLQAKVAQVNSLRDELLTK